MLAKCANPACSTPFRRLHEGKLFQVETDFVPKRTNRDREAATKTLLRRKVEHFWLCGECAPLVTLAFDQKQGVVTVPLPQGEGTKRIRVVDPACRTLPTRRQQGVPVVSMADDPGYQS